MKTKYYDKDMYAKYEVISIACLVIVTFILGFVTGIILVELEKQEYISELEKEISVKQSKIDEQYIELDALRDTVYMIEKYGK